MCGLTAGLCSYCYVHSNKNWPFLSKHTIMLRCPPHGPTVFLSYCQHKTKKQHSPESQFWLKPPISLLVQCTAFQEIYDCSHLWFKYIPIDVFMLMFTFLHVMFLNFTSHIPYKNLSLLLKIYLPCFFFPAPPPSAHCGELKWFIAPKNASMCIGERLYQIPV